MVTLMNYTRTNILENLDQAIQLEGVDTLKMIIILEGLDKDYIISLKN